MDTSANVMLIVAGALMIARVMLKLVKPGMKSMGLTCGEGLPFSALRW